MRLNEISLSPEYETMFLKIRKGSVAWMNPKKLEAVLSAMDGWSIEKAQFYAQTNNDRALVKLGMYDKNTRTALDEISVHSDMRRDHRQERMLQASSYDLAAVEAYQNEMQKYLVDSIPTVDKKSPKAVVTNISEIEKDAQYERRLQFYFTVFMKIRGYKITAPNGESFNMSTSNDLGSSGPTIERFYEWAVENTDFMDQILDKLGLEAHVKAADRPKQVKQGQTIGTCAICGHEQVVHGTNMVAHGYRRPGQGYQTDSCFGAGKDAWQISSDACVEYLPVLESNLELYREKLQELKSEKVFTFTRRAARQNAWGNEIENVTVGHPDYDKMRLGAIREAETNIRYLTQDIADMKERIASWEPGELRTR